MYFCDKCMLKSAVEKIEFAYIRAVDYLYIICCIDYRLHVGFLKPC